MKKKITAYDVIRWLYRYLVFFSLVAFVITCCMLLFVNTLTDSLGVTLTDENTGTAAKLTLVNVIILSLLFTVIDTVRRNIAVKRPIRCITEAADRIMQGDFSVRIKQRRMLAADDGFDEIISCFNKLAKELGGVEALRTDFIADVSHEMKTPLAVIQSYGTLLQMPELTDEERLKYAKGITASSRRMAEMITNILKLNRLENQQIYPNITEFDLGEQLCECLLQYESVWEASEIGIETDIGEGVTVSADSELLGLVWSNLFSNAFKFTPAGGHVFVGMTADEEYAVVKVGDTGCGMTAEVGSRIFEKFYQGDSSHTTEGNGLGLALVKRATDILNGEISVESAVGEGTVFTVKIRRSRHET